MAAMAAVKMRWAGKNPPRKSSCQMCSMRKGSCPMSSGLKCSMAPCTASSRPVMPGFAQAADAFVGFDHYEAEGTPLARQIDFDVRDFHFASAGFAG